jgi:hypothetical protein
MFCALPYPRLSDAEVDALLDGVVIPRNNGPTDADVWAEQHAQEMELGDADLAVAAAEADAMA